MNNNQQDEMDLIQLISSLTSKKKRDNIITTFSSPVDSNKKIWHWQCQSLG